MKVSQTIKHINEYIKSKGYYFEKGCVENLYLCLKSKPFVILFGPEGCGKYSLVRLFCESLGITTESGRFKFVSVGVNEYSKKELLGCKRDDGTFIPGEITAFIKRAAADRENPYFIYLDDMNMSNPDSYLSLLLKALDTRRLSTDSTFTSEPVFSNEYLENHDEYKNLVYPENLYIVGAFSADDCYYSLTMKIKDRANIIELHTGNISIIAPKSPEAPKPLNITNEFLKSKYLSAADSEEEEFMKITAATFQNINKSLKFINKEIAYRTRDEILFYLLLNKEYGLISENEAFDNVLLQRVITRIEGSEAYIKNILGIIFKLCVPKGVGDYCANSLKMFRALSYPDCRYPKSAEKITFMTRRYEEIGCCSFHNS